MGAAEQHQEVFSGIDSLPLKAYALRSGRTEKSIRRKIERGVWKEGFEWFKDPDGGINISVSGVEAWVRRNYQPGSKIEAITTESGSCGRDDGAENQSQTSRTRQRGQRKPGVYVLR